MKPMKKVIALLLAFSAFMIREPPTYASMSPLEEDRHIKLDVSYVESNYEEWEGSDLNAIFSGTGSYSVSTVAGKPAYIIGKLSEPSTISGVEMTYISNLTRARGSKIYGSVDGNQWVQLGSFPHPLDGRDKTVYHVETVSPISYEYIKIEQDSSLAQWTYTLSGITVYTTEYADGSDICSVMFDSYAGGDYNTSSANASKIFDGGNSLVWNSAEVQGVGSAYVVGAFAWETRITRVRLASHPTLFARMESATVEGSRNGSDWEVLATVPEKLDSDTVTLTVSSEGSYRYIRVCNGKDSGLFSLKCVTVWGKETILDTSPGAELRGCQFTPVSGGTYQIRFVSTIDSVNYAEVGYDIFSAEMDEEWHLSGREVCTSLKGRDADGNVTTAVVAATYGKPFLFTGIVEDVPAGQEVTFTVTPYAKQKDGTIIMGQCYLICISSEGELFSKHCEEQN